MFGGLILSLQEATDNSWLVDSAPSMGDDEEEGSSIARSGLGG